MRLIAATGIESYTVGLVHLWHFVKFQVLMGAAKDSSAGDQARYAGGVASVVYDKKSGEIYLRPLQNLGQFCKGKITGEST